jgi:hypothetical protein
MLGHIARAHVSDPVMKLADMLEMSIIGGAGQIMGS